MLNEIDTLIEEQTREIKKFNLVMFGTILFGLILAIVLPFFDLGLKSEFVNSGIGVLVGLSGLLAELPNSRKRIVITKLKLIKNRWIEGDEEKRKALEEKMEELLFNLG